MRFELESISSGTIVTITEEGYEDTPEGRAMILECASGWGEAGDIAESLFWSTDTARGPGK